MNKSFILKAYQAKSKCRKNLSKSFKNRMQRIEAGQK
jgi:hypothetical protein